MENGIQRCTCCMSPYMPHMSHTSRTCTPPTIIGAVDSQTQVVQYGCKVGCCQTPQVGEASSGGWVAATVREATDGRGIEQPKRGINTRDGRRAGCLLGGCASCGIHTQWGADEHPTHDQRKQHPDLIEWVSEVYIRNACAGCFNAIPGRLVRDHNPIIRAVEQRVSCTYWTVSCAT